MIERHITRIVDAIRLNPLSRKIIGGSFWSVAGTFLSRGLMAVAAVVTARILGRQVFGQYGAVRSTLTMFIAFAGFGLGLTASRHIALYRSNQKRRAGEIVAFSLSFALITGTCVAATVFAAAPLLAQRILGDAGLTLPLRISAIALIFAAINGAQDGCLSGLHAFRRLAVSRVIGSAMAFPPMVFLTYRYGLNGAVVGVAMNSLIIACVQGMALSAELRHQKIVSKSAGFRKCLALTATYSLPATLAGLAVTPVDWICTAFLVRTPNGFDKMGYFTAALQLVLPLRFLVSRVASVLLPVLSSAGDSGEKSRRGMDYAQRLIIFTMVPASFFLMAAAPLVVDLFGQGFDDAVVPTILLTAAVSISAVATPAGTMIQAQGKMWLCFVMNLTHAVVYASITYLVVQGHGASGRAAGFLMAHAALATWSYLYLRHTLGGKLIKRTFGILLVVLVGAVVFSLLYH
jgi:O-antigen/teichoic acid export membrane protein